MKTLEQLKSEPSPTLDPVAFKNACRSLGRLARQKAQEYERARIVPPKRRVRGNPLNPLWAGKDEIVREIGW
jgi:hypothetical protein